VTLLPAKSLSKCEALDEFLFSCRKDFMEFYTRNRRGQGVRILGLISKAEKRELFGTQV
jgi:hypothetical protein